MSEPAGKTRIRPVSSVLDVLRVQMDLDSFDAALLSLETVAADLGYGDIRALPGSLAWIEQLREHDKRIGLFATGDRANAALQLAGIADAFDEVAIGTNSAPTLLTAIAALGTAPDRTIVVTASAAAVSVAREVGAGLVVALARGASSPEELRQAGASTVVADLQELLRALT